MEPLFHDVQPLRVRRLRWRLASLPIFLTMLAVLQIGFGRHWGTHIVRNRDLVAWTILLWIVYLWLVRVRLEIEVVPGRLIVGLRGLFRRTRVGAEQWLRWEATRFDAARDFGGYGLRRIGTTRAYVAGGNEGVRLTLRDGGVLILGTDRPGDLVAALARASGRPS